MHRTRACWSVGSAVLRNQRPSQSCHHYRHGRHAKRPPCMDKAPQLMRDLDLVVPRTVPPPSDAPGTQQRLLWSLNTPCSSVYPCWPHPAPLTLTSPPPLLCPRAFPAQCKPPGDAPHPAAAHCMPPPPPHPRGPGLPPPSTPLRSTPLRPRPTLTPHQCPCWPPSMSQQTPPPTLPTPSPLARAASRTHSAAVSLLAGLPRLNHLMVGNPPTPKRVPSSRCLSASTCACLGGEGCRKAWRPDGR